MAVPIKAILIDKGERIGTGYAAFMQKKDQAVDISQYGEALSDATSSTAHGYIIKNGKVYTIVRNYLNLDENCRYIMARDENNSFDQWPVS